MTPVRPTPILIMRVASARLYLYHLSRMKNAAQQKGCRTAAESPQRSEDLQRMAGTIAENRCAADSPHPDRGREIKYSF